jgi:hypothetical protein
MQVDAGDERRVESLSTGAALPVTFIKAKDTYGAELYTVSLSACFLYA